MEFYIQNKAIKWMFVRIFQLGVSWFGSRTQTIVNEHSAFSLFQYFTGDTGK